MAAEVDIVSFCQHDFPALESDLKAKVTLERTGACKGVLEVRVVTLDATDAGGFQAQPDADYVPADTKVRFEDGQKESVFEIDLLATDAKWLPSRSFFVELKEVVEGQAALGGPSLSRWDASSRRPLARICIVQDDTFPSGIPEEKVKSDKAEFWLCYYYIKNRIKSRGKKFWKTMAGYCYEPVHSVVVVPLIQSYILDWAAKPGEGGSVDKIVLLASLNFLSSMFYRSGDYLQVNNRGRTGGARMLHRTQLLSKLLMMDHEQQFSRPGCTWFYSALNNVDSMVTDCYWQIMVMAQSVWALVLCLLTLLWKSWYKRAAAGLDVNLENFIPVLVLLLVIPTVHGFVWARRKTLARLLEERMQGEEGWVEVFAWVAEHGRRIYNFGPRESAKIDSMFSARSSAFVKKHGLARDYTNDGKWITIWICHSVYCLMLAWGAFKLLHARQEIGSADFSAGDCLILIQVFDKFGKYLVKFEGATISMQKASVAIGRVSELLGLQEKRNLVGQLKDGSAHAASVEGEAAAGGDHSATQEASNKNHIVLRDVQLELPQTWDGFGPVVAIQAKMPGKDTCIPLGKVIYVKGGTENRRLTFLTLLGQLLAPTKGSVIVPRSEWSILLPTVPTDLPDCSVKHDLMLSGATEDIACKLAQIFDLDPDEGHVRLPSGKALMLGLARSMLRNPTILMAVRPMASTVPENQDKVMRLLWVWQKFGGGQALVNLLGSNDLPSVCSKNHRDLQQRRTLVISGEDPPDFIPKEELHILDLDQEYERLRG